MIQVPIHIFKIKYFLMKELYTVPMQIFISVNNDEHYKNAS